MARHPCQCPLVVPGAGQSGPTRCPPSRRGTTTALWFSPTAPWLPGDATSACTLCICSVLCHEWTRGVEGHRCLVDVDLAVDADMDGLCVFVYVFTCMVLQVWTAGARGLCVLCGAPDPGSPCCDPTGLYSLCCIQPRDYCRVLWHVLHTASDGCRAAAGVWAKQVSACTAP